MRVNTLVGGDQRDGLSCAVPVACKQVMDSFACSGAGCLMLVPNSVRYSEGLCDWYGTRSVRYLGCAAGTQQLAVPFLIHGAGTSSLLRMRGTGSLGAEGPMAHRGNRGGGSRGA